MIRYPVTAAELEARINAHAHTWRTRAAGRTARLRGLGRYEEVSDIWGEIKPVYMRLQSEKCAYCERKLASERYGTIEHDVEHYRPKSSVNKWPSEEIKVTRSLNYRFQTGDDWAEGYYLLAYNIFNYITACKPCNSVLKSNYFPIYGARGVQSDDYRTLTAEQPLLIYPLSDFDDDPAELITFNGIFPIPKKNRSSGYKFYRARVTIDFFDLEQREDLRRERATQLSALWMALQLLENPTDDVQRIFAERSIERFRDAAWPHCNCVRAFYNLYQRDRQAAQDIIEQVDRYLDSLFP